MLSSAYPGICCPDHTDCVFKHLGSECLHCGCFSHSLAEWTWCKLLPTLGSFKGISSWGLSLSQLHLTWSEISPGKNTEYLILGLPLLKIIWEKEPHIFLTVCKGTQPWRLQVEWRSDTRVGKEGKVSRGGGGGLGWFPGAGSELTAARGQGGQLEPATSVSPFPTFSLWSLSLWLVTFRFFLPWTLPSLRLKGCLQQKWKKNALEGSEWEECYFRKETINGEWISQKQFLKDCVGFKVQETNMR